MYITHFRAYENCLLISQTLISKERLAKRSDLEPKTRLNFEV